MGGGVGGWVGGWEGPGRGGARPGACRRSRPMQWHACMCARSGGSRPQAAGRLPRPRLCVAASPHACMCSQHACAMRWWFGPWHQTHPMAGDGWPLSVTCVYLSSLCRPLVCTATATATQVLSWAGVVGSVARWHPRSVTVWRGRLYLTHNKGDTEPLETRWGGWGGGGGAGEGRGREGQGRAGQGTCHPPASLTPWSHQVAGGQAGASLCGAAPHSAQHRCSRAEPLHRPHCLLCCACTCAVLCCAALCFAVLCCRLQGLLARLAPGGAVPPSGGRHPQRGGPGA